MSTVQQRIIETLATHAFLDPKAVKLTDRLDVELAFDSLDKVEAAMAIEHDFEIEIPDERLEALVTVQDVITLVQSMIPISMH